MKENILQLRQARLVPGLVLALALTVLGAAIFIGTARLRHTMREQMVNHDGEILQAVALARQFSTGTETNLAARLQNPTEQLALILNISQIEEGVLAVRLFDAKGKFVTAFPTEVAEAGLDSPTVMELKRLHSVSHYRPDGALADVFVAGSAAAATNATPLIEVNIPIHARGQTQLIASAQIILDAQNLAREFAALDQNLWGPAGLAFLVGGGVLTLAFVWAYRRLQHSNTLLQERTARLLRANHELALAAKTGALGSVTAHLVHGLSNPLANLQNFVAASQGPADQAWPDIVAATQRMQQIVHDAVRVLGEETGVDNYELTLAELAEILREKIQSLGQTTGVHYEIKTQAEAKLVNRDANLMLLILENLTRNALQATARGRRVRVIFTANEQAVICAVSDEGPGIPPELRPRLFTPCHSTKGGNGIGLAISHHLARQMGAKLELVKTDDTGSIFQLTIPTAILAMTTAEA